VTEIMIRDQTLIPVDMDQEDVALRFQKYALVSAAVVDDEGRLVGMITVDDVVHIIQEEAGEDVLLLSQAGDGDINEPIRFTIRSRMWWLFINLGTEILSVAVIGYYQDLIAKLVVLAMLMPVITGMGGNAATQTMAVTVRALATGQLTGSNSWRMIFREWWIASANGWGLGLIMLVGVQAIYHDWGLSLVTLLSMSVGRSDSARAQQTEDRSRGGIDDLRHDNDRHPGVFLFPRACRILSPALSLTVTADGPDQGRAEASFNKGRVRLPNHRSAWQTPCSTDAPWRDARAYAHATEARG
jgi:hypothetical protein